MCGRSIQVLDQRGAARAPGTLPFGNDTIAEIGAGRHDADVRRGVDLGGVPVGFPRPDGVDLVDGAVLPDGSDAYRQAFAEWLDRQLRVRRLSQRQVAIRSGLDKSTISRLLRGDRAPTLRTATMLVEALGVDRADPDRPPSIALQSVDPVGPASPTTRVERALRGDDLLDEADVQAVMRLYLAARNRTTLRPSAVRRTS